MHFFLFKNKNDEKLYCFFNSGDSYSLTVEDDENLIPYIVTDVNNGVLNIHYKDGYSIMDDHKLYEILNSNLIWQNIGF